jgi:hypothetical protein
MHKSTGDFSVQKNATEAYLKNCGAKHFFGEFTLTPRTITHEA